VLAVYKDSKGITREFTYQDLPFDRFDMAAQENEDVHFTVELFHSTERLSLEDPRFAEIRKFFPVYERFDPVRGEYTYSVGGAETVADMYLIYKKVKELQFLEAEVIALHEEKLTDMSELALLSVEELNNTVVRASTVLFGYDRSTFDAEFERSLQKIKDLLYEHADLRVVIEAHTDSKGKNDYNLKLSQKRAQSIVDWLVAHGVEKDRMTPVGFGEDHPIASNENEIGRGRNRRVEFRLAMDKQDQANLRRR
jgi:outer membrane protein OmpA-like peptidoglycan-associated protein